MSESLQHVFTRESGLLSVSCVVVAVLNEASHVNS